MGNININTSIGAGMNTNRKYRINKILDTYLISDIIYEISTYDYHLSGTNVKSFHVSDRYYCYLTSLPMNQFTYLGTSKHPSIITEEDLTWHRNNIHNNIQTTPRPFKAKVYIASLISDSKILFEYETIKYSIYSFPKTFICDKTINVANCELLIYHNNKQFIITLGTDQSDCIIKLKDDEYCIGTFNGYVQIWNFETTTLKYSFKAHDGKILSMTSIDDFLITSSEDNSVKIWDLATGLIIFDLIDSEMKNPFRIYTLDTQIFILHDIGICVWNYKTGHKIISKKFKQPYSLKYLDKDQFIIFLNAQILILNTSNLDIISKFNFNYKSYLILPNNEILLESQTRLLRVNLTTHIVKFVYELKYEITDMQLLSNGMVLIMSKNLIEIID